MYNLFLDIGKRGGCVKQNAPGGRLVHWRCVCANRSFRAKIVTACHPFIPILQGDLASEAGWVPLKRWKKRLRNPDWIRNVIDAGCPILLCRHAGQEESGALFTRKAAFLSQTELPCAGGRPLMIMNEDLMHKGQGRFLPCFMVYIRYILLFMLYY